jgi:hypothetical protein
MFTSSCEQLKDSLFARSVKMISLNREEYETHVFRMLRAAGYSVVEAEEHLAKAYPKSTDQAVQELRARGLVVPPWRVEQFAKSSACHLRVVGKARVWFKPDIDEFAEILEAEGHLTAEAQACRTKGVPYGKVVLKGAHSSVLS